MANTYKVLGQVAPAATTPTAVYTVPAGKSAIISTLNVCNRATSPRTFRVAIRVGGAVLSNAAYVAYDASILANDVTAITIGMTLGADDILEVYGATNELSFTAFGTEM